MKPNGGLTVASRTGMGFITPLEEVAAKQGVEILLETREQSFSKMTAELSVEGSVK